MKESSVVILSSSPEKSYLRKEGSKRAVKRGPRNTRSAVAGASRKPAKKAVAKRGVGLKTSLISIMKGSKKPMAPKDLSQKLLAKGYKTQSSDVGNVVRTTLQRSKEFKRVGMGLYQLDKRFV